MNDVKHCGYLLKKRGFKNWKNRFFELDQTERILYSYENDSKANLKLKISLGEVLQITLGPKQFSFTLEHPTKTTTLAGKNQEETNDWLEILHQYVLGKTIYEGLLEKRGSIRKNWKRRYFVLTSMKVLKYYVSDKKIELLGKINLEKVQVIRTMESKEGHDWTIEMSTKIRHWYFCCDTSEHMERWYRLLCHTIGNPKRLVHIKQSLLLKRLDSKNQWQWWHFALCNGWLFYFPTEEVAQEFQLISFFDEARFEEYLGKYSVSYINLSACIIAEVGDFSGMDNVFTIQTKKICYFLSTENETLLREWLHALKMQGDAVKQNDLQF